MNNESAIRLKHLPGLLKQAFISWNREDPFAKSAAVAFYAIFSLPGLLIIVVTIIGQVMDDPNVAEDISQRLVSLMGKGSAEDVEKMINDSRIQGDNWFMSMVGIGTLIFAATGLFFQLQKSLNEIWEVQKKSTAGILVMLKDRALSLGLVIVIAFLLLIFLILSTAISLLNEWIASTFSPWISFVTYFMDISISLGVITLLFASIFKVLPDVEISWGMVWKGAFITAILFSMGKLLIGYYLSMADPASSFGAAGIIIIVLLWVSFSCMIVFFGAEFTQVYARTYNKVLRPSAHAEYTAAYRLKKMGESEVEITEKRST